MNGTGPEPTDGSRGDRSGPEVYQYPAFFDRLEKVGSADLLSLLDGTPRGIVYHHRGLRVPGHNVTFVHEPAAERDVPAFSVQVDSVGPRSTWAVFDATADWDLFYVPFGKAAALAWMCNGEFEAEEADHFGAKPEAIAHGQFSFGIFIDESSSWNDQVQDLEATSSPAIIQLGDGRAILPQTEAEFYEETQAIPAEVRPGGVAPGYLGLLDVEFSVNE